MPLAGEDGQHAIVAGSTLTAAVEQDARGARDPARQCGDDRDLTALGERLLPAQQQAHRMAGRAVPDAERHGLKDGHGLLLDALDGRPI
jgi:hypothetical protein